MGKIFDEEQPKKTNSFYDVVYDSEEDIEEAKKILGIGIEETFDEFRDRISKEKNEN